MKDQNLETADEQDAMVAILNLQVIIAPDGDQWTAQAIEIDYAAGGTSQEDVKERFEAGLCATIHEHLKRFGTVKRLLVAAPSDLWLSLIRPKTLERFSQVSFHRFMPENLDYDTFPFGGIQYFRTENEQGA